MQGGLSERLSGAGVQTDEGARWHRTGLQVDECGVGGCRRDGEIG
jgi:hypothetical protein